MNKPNWMFQVEAVVLQPTAHEILAAASVRAHLIKAREKKLQDAVHHSLTKGRSQAMQKNFEALYGGRVRTAGKGTGPL